MATRGRRAAGSASRRSPASPARSARPRSRTSAPTARRSPQTIATVRVWDRVLQGVAHLRRRRLRLRLPHQPVQGRPRPPRRPRGHLPVPPGRASARRWRTPSWPARSASSRASGPRWPTSARPCSGCAGARAWCSTPPTTTPGAPGRSSPTRCVDAADALPEGAPAWPQPDGTVKTSAAWLIEHAGFGKGYGDGPVGLSTKHTLALTNRGGATTARPARAGPRGPRRGRGSASASGWSTSRCWSAARSDAQRPQLLALQESTCSSDDRERDRRRPGQRCPRTSITVPMMPMTCRPWPCRGRRSGPGRRRSRLTARDADRPRERRQEQQSRQTSDADQADDPEHHRRRRRRVVGQHAAAYAGAYGEP